MQEDNALHRIVLLLFVEKQFEAKWSLCWPDFQLGKALLQWKVSDMV